MLKVLWAPLVSNNQIYKKFSAPLSQFNHSCNLANDTRPLIRDKIPTLWTSKLLSFPLARLIIAIIFSIISQILNNDFQIKCCFITSVVRTQGGGWISFLKLYWKYWQFQKSLAKRQMEKRHHIYWVVNGKVFLYFIDIILFTQDF